MPSSLPDSEHCLISPLLPRFLVWVEVDRRPVRVYSKSQPEKGKTVCYIEAIEGKRFTVEYADLRKSPPEDPFVLNLTVDGSFCNAYLHRQSNRDYRDSRKAAWRHESFAGRQTSNDRKERPFLFAPLVTTDDETVACSNKEVINNLGSISVVYERVKNVSEGGTIETKLAGEESTKPIHEKDKKAKLSHQTTYGEAKPIDPQVRDEFDWIDEEGHPLQTFEFYYRSRVLLELEGHVPSSLVSRARPARSPTPPVLSNSEREAKRQAVAKLRGDVATLRKEGFDQLPSAASSSSSARDDASIGDWEMEEGERGGMGKRATS